VLTDVTADEPHPAFRSLFDQRVFVRIASAGSTSPRRWRSTGAHRPGGDRRPGRLAVECDGQDWVGTEVQREADLDRERELKRAGWRFWRVRESEFAFDPDAALATLWQTLDRLDIEPYDPADFVGVASNAIVWRPTELSTVEGLDGLDGDAPRNSTTSISRWPDRFEAYVGEVTSFGEQGGLLTYGSYLRVRELLAQQVPESDPPAHDELLFITIHQVYELWFQLLLSELTDARDRMLAGETYLPRVRLERCHVIERVLVSQVDVIDTMTPQDFLASGPSSPRRRGSSPPSSARSSSCPGSRIRRTSTGCAVSARRSRRHCCAGWTSRRCGTGTWPCCSPTGSPPPPWTSASTRCARSRTTVRSTGRCGTSLRPCWTMIRRGRCGGPGTC
jgi:hypothetical protein